MYKHIAVIIFAIILTIAYCDFIDSIKRLDKVLSNVLRLDNENKINENQANKNFIFLPLKSKH